MIVEWADVLTELTPWEDRGGRWYKREDYCAPLGYGSVNGAKFRQCLHLLQRAKLAGSEGIITGASVLSPQLPMSAVIADHVGLPLQIVIGGTTLKKAVKHINVRIAVEYGATFQTIKVGYNPALQSTVAQVADLTGWYQLRYGISPDVDDDSILEFHTLGGNQVANTPDEIKHLIIPTGSANSTISILLGLSQHVNNVRKVTLIGIGPNREKLIANRLALFKSRLGVSLNPDVVVEMVDLHTPRLVTYGQRVPASLDGIDFHPTYEGKVVDHLLRHPTIAPGFINGDHTTGLWIIGSEPKG